MSEASILVGDVGGTNVRLALARAAQGAVSVSDIWKRPGEDFPTFEAAIAAYRKETSAQLFGASFGVAGAVSGGRTQLLHRDWFIDGPRLKEQLGVPRVVVVNDFVAMARSAPDLAPAATHEIAPGKADPEGSIAVGGPGTGFGLAILRRLLRDDGGQGGWMVTGGEGGHQAFAPQTGFEWEVARRLQADLGYVSNETVASGSGFDATLCAVAAAMGVRHEALTPAQVETRAAEGDALALALCQLRAATVMTALGDAALASNASGGVFIAGGVSVRLERYLREPEALARFYQRGPRSGLMGAIPLRLIVSEEAPLLGAAHLWLDEQARGWL
jgi:glucokinase